MMLKPMASSENTAFSVSSSARFWETRRLLYNLVLIATAIFWLLLDWNHFRPAMKLSSLPPLVVLALLANVCYCTAYLADFAIQRLPAAQWRRYRWIIWGVGTLFATVLESYWINDEIYPGVVNAATILLRG
jgi:hypothetical protein